MSRASKGLQTFAVDDTTAQLTWSALPAGHLEVRGPGRRVDAESDGGPGGVLVDGLTPATTVELAVSVDGRPVGSVGATTSADPWGAELYRFASITDLHLGAVAFDLHGRMIEQGLAPTEAHPVRCARAAVRDAIAWGAERIVVKGDVTNVSHTHHWALAADVLGGLPVPVDMIPGNHDRNHRATVDAFAEARRHGLSLHSDVSTVDVPGLRLMFVDSTVAGIDIGVWRPHRAAMLDAVAEVRTPVLLVVHHPPMATTVPLHLPRGIPAAVANPILRRLRHANAQVMGTSGHNHRHRRRVVAGVPWFETGSTKDYPGTWTGYVVHEGGIRQVTRRITDPDCIGWTEQTRRAAAGAWGRWSPGTLADRCFVLEW